MLDLSERCRRLRSKLCEMGGPRTKVELTGVPETALWNLYQRASAVRARHLDDPRAVEVLARLDYPFQRFDLPYSGLAARLHAQRVRTIDAALRHALAGAPDATVVALGEGFETQFWRVDDGRLRWISLDLPELAAVRREVLPDGPRNRTLAGSADDAAWTAQVDRERPLIITAQGLLPYFERDEVHRLLSTWARLLPGGWLLFDAVTAQMQAVRRRNEMALPVVLGHRRDHVSGSLTPARSVRKADILLWRRR